MFDFDPEHDFEPLVHEIWSVGIELSKLHKTMIPEIRELRRTIAAAAIIATGKPISDRWAADHQAARKRLQQELTE